MTLPTREHTAGNKRRFVVDYREWMNPGATVSAFTAVLSPSTVTATVTGAAIQDDQTCVFFVNGGAEGEEFEVDLTLTTSYGEIKIDVVPFVVIAP